MKLTVAAAALALAMGTAASAFAAPPASTAPAAPAAHAAITTPAKALKVNGTIKSVSDTTFTLTNGKIFRLDATVKSTSLKAGEKVKVEYRMKDHQRWATGVSPS